MEELDKKIKVEDTNKSLGVNTPGKSLKNST